MFSKDLFKDQIILVTGGRSGIGYTIARLFLQHGGQVVIASRKEESLKQAAEELGKEGNCDYFPCDIRKTDQISALANFIKEKHGRLDILINNAGGQFPMKAEEITENGWTAVINNNLNGTFFITKEMANTFFIPQNKGNVVSIIADIFRGFPSMAHTGAARAGVENLTKSLAVEWCKYHIRLNCVAPGIIRSSGLDQYPPEFIGGMEKAIPMKRMGTMEEVAFAVLFLASPLASFTTGDTLYVDGGRKLYGDFFPY